MLSEECGLHNGMCVCEDNGVCADHGVCEHMNNGAVCEDHCMCVCEGRGACICGSSVELFGL